MMGPKDSMLEGELGSSPGSPWGLLSATYLPHVPKGLKDRQLSGLPVSTV